MCCALAVLAFLGPRALALFWWLFQPARFNLTFQSFIWPLLGFIFIPWTTLMYVLVYPGGLNGLDWVWLGLALMIDIASYSGSAYGNRDKIPGMA